jgi:outer membrane murein-binding lipoprotein Lpp
MQKTLENVSAKALSLQNSGKDVTAVLASYGAAQSAVTNAGIAVSAQAGKSYDISGGTGTDVKTDVSSGVKSLETDLVLLKKEMEAARSAVSAAVKALSEVAK